MTFPRYCWDWQCARFRSNIYQSHLRHWCLWDRLLSYEMLQEIVDQGLQEVFLKHCHALRTYQLLYLVFLFLLSQNLNFFWLEPQQSFHENEYERSLDHNNTKPCYLYYFVTYLLLEENKFHNFLSNFVCVCVCGSDVFVIYRRIHFLTNTLFYTGRKNTVSLLLYSARLKMWHEGINVFFKT